MICALSTSPEVAKLCSKAVRVLIATDNELYLFDASALVAESVLFVSLLLSLSEMSKNRMKFLFVCTLFGRSLDV